MARNSSSSPGVVEELLSIVEAHLGEGTAHRFLARFKMTDYFGELQKPMLRGVGEWLPAMLDGVGHDKISGVRIENPSPQPMDVVLTVDIPRTSAEDVFSRFVTITAHANPLGDFRNFPDRYAPVLLGPRYFLFHGDGHCFALANLLASLLARTSEAEFGVRYTSSKDRSFIHTFVTANGDGQTTTIFDADQKAIVEEGDATAPHGMIYQLLGLAGALTFETASKRGWQWMFAEQTRRYFAESYADQATAPRIYRRQPTPEIISNLFAKAIADHVEAVSLDVDDYDWKAPFRDACGGEALLSHIDRPVRLVVPPGGRIAIGIDAEALPIESRVLPLIFFGRVPATVSAEIFSGSVAFELPERPWLICLPSAIKQVVVNGHAVDTHESGEFAVVGASDLDGLVGEPGVSGTAPLVVSGPAGTTVRVVLPFNALAFNSGSIKIRCDAIASIAGPRVPQ